MEENTFAQKLGAEALGTAVLVFVGAGAVPALFLARGGTGGAPFTGAELLAISTAFGLAVVAMVYSIGKISGCHINPAVTIAMAVTKRMQWAHAVPYVIAQCVGATLGGLAIWGVFAHRVSEGAGVGHVAYGPNTAIGSAMLNEGLGTAILLFTIVGSHRQARRRRAAGRTRDRPDRDRHHHHRRRSDRCGHQPGPVHRHPDHLAAGRSQHRLGTGMGVLDGRRARRDWRACSPTTCFRRPAGRLRRPGGCAASLEPTVVESPA